MRSRSWSEMKDGLVLPALPSRASFLRGKSVQHPLCPCADKVLQRVLRASAPPSSSKVHYNGRAKYDVSKHKRSQTSQRSRCCRSTEDQSIRLWSAKQFAFAHPFAGNIPDMSQ